MVNSLRFSSTIRFVSHKRFLESLPLEKMKSKNQYTNVRDGFYIHLNGWRYSSRVLTQEEGFTDRATCCTIGGVTDQKHVILYHLNPLEKQWDQDAKELSQGLVTDLFQNGMLKENKQRGVIAAGDHRNPVCRKYFALIRALYDRLNIPFSAFWGQLGGIASTHLYHSVPEDTWVINSQRFDEEYYFCRQLGYAQTFQDVLTPEALKEQFQLIHVDSGDTLYIEDEPVPADEVNQNKLNDAERKTA